MAIVKEKVLEVKHYTDRLFHFKTTRDSGTRFRDGEFLMIGLEVEVNLYSEHILLHHQTMKNIWNGFLLRYQMDH